MRLMSFDSIQKKLDEKNAELLEVRSLHKKLADKEKNICADIEYLQNQKVELIFLQVKRESKNEKLDISSSSVLPLLQALTQVSHLLTIQARKKIVTQTNLYLADPPKITDTGRNIDEIFENHRAVAKKICQSIRKNGGQLVNAKFFLERPYCDDAHSYKFSSANFLRLLAADNDAIRKCNPRRISVD